MGKAVGLMAAMVLIGVGALFLPMIKDVTEGVLDSFGLELSPFETFVMSAWSLIIFIAILYGAIMLIRRGSA